MPTNVARIALTMNPAVHVQPVRTSARCAATGLVPLRYRLRPARVLASTIPVTTASTTQIDHDGRDGEAERGRDDRDGRGWSRPAGCRCTAPRTQPVSTPDSSAPTASVTTSGSMRNR